MTDFQSCGSIFPKLNNDKYLILEVMMYVEHPSIYNFMYALNKEGRKFVQENYITISNGFNNEGLITLYLKNDFNYYEKLERLYF